MAEIVGEDGYGAATVTAICARAGLSRQTFYQRFDGRESCFLAVLDEGYSQSATVIVAAFGSAGTWRDGIREAFAALLVLFETRPRVARVWMIESITAGPWALAYREKRIHDLTEMVVGYWKPSPGAARGSHPAATTAVMAAVLAAIQRHLAIRAPEPLIELLGPLMGIATSPFLDPACVSAEIRRGEALAEEIRSAPRLPTELESCGAPGIPTRLLDARAHRARAVLAYLIAHPGASNRDLARAVGIPSDPQISGLLNRLVKMGMVHKRAGGPGLPNASTLTARGEAVAKALDNTVASSPIPLIDRGAIHSEVMT